MITLVSTAGNIKEVILNLGIIKDAVLFINYECACKRACDVCDELLHIVR